MLVKLEFIQYRMLRFVLYVVRLQEKAQFLYILGFHCKVLYYV